MTTIQAIKEGEAYLLGRGIEAPRLEAESLVAHGMGLERVALFLDPLGELSEQRKSKIFSLFSQRGARRPLQHILGSVSFCGQDILVNANALIPRPETEALAEQVWTFLNGLPPLCDTVQVRALDFGTGSGCVAISVATRCPKVEIWAMDICPAALALAERNAAMNRVQEQIRFLRADGLEALAPDTVFDLIVSNPPYIPTLEIDHLQPEVKDHDPRIALDGGIDGLDHYRRLAYHGASFLKPKSPIMMEIGDGQATSVRDIFAGRGWVGGTTLKDLSGRERIVIAYRAPMEATSRSQA